MVKEYEFALLRLSCSSHRKVSKFHIEHTSLTSVYKSISLPCVNLSKAIILFKCVETLNLAIYEPICSKLMPLLGKTGLHSLSIIQLNVALIMPCREKSYVLQLMVTFYVILNIQVQAR